ncbi:MAG: hypothetical protein ACE5HF_03875 [Gemmatimonadota bacterium]
MPEAGDLSEAQWRDVEALVARAISRRPPGIRRRVALLLRLLDGLAFLGHGRRLARLDAGRRTRFLERLQDSGSPTLRSGIWGLRTLSFLGYYGRAEVATELGYAARAGGWSALE